MSSCPITWETVVSEPFAENSFLVTRDGSDACIVVDPGFEPEKIKALWEARGLKVLAVLNTHGHSDHIAGNAFMKEHWPTAPLVIGANDAPKLTDPNLNLSAQYGFGLVSPEADQQVREGDQLEFGGITLEVLETPGHSIGHVVFLHRGAEPWTVIGGDVLFRQGVGRTDFPDGDTQQLVASIQNKLYVLPDDTVVLTGHGPSTTIGFEKVNNPFVRAQQP